MPRSYSRNNVTIELTPLEVEALDHILTEERLRPLPEIMYKKALSRFHNKLKHHVQRNDTSGLTERQEDKG